jgi:hypothetical protein
VALLYVTQRRAFKGEPGTADEMERRARALGLRALTEQFSHAGSYECGYVSAGPRAGFGVSIYYPMVKQLTVT